MLLTLLTPGLAQSADRLRFVALDFAPFIYGENQNVAGPGYKIVAAVCARAGIECSYDIYPWRRAQELMKSGEADGMMVIGPNPKREGWIRFTPPHFRTEYGVFVHVDNPLQLDEVSQLAGLRIGVFAPSNTATQLTTISRELTDAGYDAIDIEGRPDDASGFHTRIFRQPITRSFRRGLEGAVRQRRGPAHHRALCARARSCRLTPPSRAPSWRLEPGA